MIHEVYLMIVFYLSNECAPEAVEGLQVLNVIFFEILNMLCKNVKVYKEREFTKEATEL